MTDRTETSMRQIAKRGDKVIVTTGRGEQLCIVVGPQTKSPHSGLEELLVVEERDNGEPKWVPLDTIYLPVEQLAFTDGTTPARVEDDGLVVPQNEGPRMCPMHPGEHKMGECSWSIEQLAAELMESHPFQSAEVDRRRCAICGDERQALVHGKPNVVDEDWQRKFVPVVVDSDNCLDCGAAPATEHDPECAYYLVAMTRSVEAERGLTDDERRQVGWAERVIHALEAPPRAPVEETPDPEIERHRALSAAQAYTREVILQLKRWYPHQFIRTIDSEYSIDSDLVGYIADQMELYKPF